MKCDEDMPDVIYAEPDFCKNEDHKAAIEEATRTQREACEELVNQAQELGLYDT